MLEDYFVYNDKNIVIKASEKDFITIFGSGDKTILDNLAFINDNNYITLNYKAITKKNINDLISKMGYSYISFIDSFTSETVMDELAFNLESQAKSKKEMKTTIKEFASIFNFEGELEKSPILLDDSSKAKLSILRNLISKPKVLIIDNLLSLLDKDDYLVVTNYLKEYVSLGNIIINFTSEIEESLLGNKVMVINDDKVLIEGNTISVLNEEKIMKRLNISLPFIILLNRYLKDYELIDRYYLTLESLGGALWK